MNDKSHDNYGNKPMGQVIHIDEGRIKDHLGVMVRGTVEEALNAMVDTTVFFDQSISYVLSCKLKIVPITPIEIHRKRVEDALETYLSHPHGVTSHHPYIQLSRTERTLNDWRDV